MADTSDRDGLRAKYREERDKRIRPDGNEQYIQPTGRFAHLLDDPYTPRVEREPLFDEVTVAVIGGGFSGLTTGARLKQAGIDDIRIIEGAGDVGGAWYWNRYPGAMCDTAAMVYLPLLEETGYMPTMKYVYAPEIFAHARRIATHFGLYDNAVLSTQVTELRWDEASSHWIIHTDRGDAIRAKFVTMGTGPLHRPKLPGVPGIEDFAGECFHTSRWDYDLTGGDPSGAPMTRLAGKRVGIIGTGATAVQCIPPLSRDSGELFVFQRTPSAIDVRNNHPIDPDWFASLGKGWQQQWLTNFATLQTGGFTDEDLVRDGWTDIAKRIRDRVVKMLEEGAAFDPETTLLAYEESDDEKMSEIRDRVDRIVADPATAQKLKPWFRQLCKRPCFHDEYLQAYNNPTTHLIDTDGKGVERIDADGVWANGQHYDLDVIIYASGFEVGTPAARRSGFETYGRGGLSLTDKWGAGMQSKHGMHVHGFPNLFIVGPTHGSNLISNITQNLTEAGTTIALILSHALRTSAAQIEVTSAAEAEWVELMLSSDRGFLGNPDCTPGYYNNEGGPIGLKERLNASGYPDGPIAYWEYLDRWRSNGAFAGLAFS